jgi:hypothetical protein
MSRLERYFIPAAFKIGERVRVVLATTPHTDRTGIVLSIFNSSPGVYRYTVQFDDADEKDFFFGFELVRTDLARSA